jgi:hypothetical protein
LGYEYTEWNQYYPLPKNFMSMAEVTAQYDEEFFEDNLLVFATFNENVESLYFDVQNVRLNENTLIIDVNQYYMEIANQITGRKLVQLELPKADYGDIKEVEVIFNVVVMYK